MRRISIILAFAVLVLAGIVGYTLKRGFDARARLRAAGTPKIRVGDEFSARAWVYAKDDAEGNKPIVRLVAQAIRATKDPSTFELMTVALKLFDKDATHYTYVKSAKALFDERSKVLTSSGPVQIFMNIPSGQNADEKAVADKHVRVDTTGIVYDTNSGKANTEQLAKFVFPDGGGHATGVDYDPNTKLLHLHSLVSLDWVGSGPVEDALHVETSDLVYNEAEQKIYMKPTAKLLRRRTTMEAANVVVALEGGRLHQITGDHAHGGDQREDRQTQYSADQMVALFNENGTLVNMVGDHNARVVSKQSETETTLAGDHSDLRFAVENKQTGNVVKEDSTLHLVLTDGHAMAEAVPVITPEAKARGTLADTRTLRSDHIELEMQPGGLDIKEIRTAQQAQLEFKPNRPGVPHRVVDANPLRVIYGEGSYVDTFLAWKVKTRTDKPGLSGGKPPAPGFTWSDQLTAHFQPRSNNVASIEQVGNFRYEEGLRKANSAKAYLDQTANKMTLSEGAHVADDTGATNADRILMNQANGDMDASGHVISTRAPDKNQKPGTSMLDDAEPMQAKADTMETRDNNTRIRYSGHAVLWQGANRTVASEIDIDRDNQTLHATGNVVSELLDKKSSDASPPAQAAQGVQLKPVVAQTEPAAADRPIFTTVYAPEMVYSDQTRIAHYTGGVKLLRNRMTVISKELTAYLTPKTPGSDDSSLDHAIATGAVTVHYVREDNRTRTGTGEECDYSAKDDKATLTGGSPQMVDSYKGVTRGTKLTYFNQDDHLIVDGGVKQVYTEMKKKNK